MEPELIADYKCRVGEGPLWHALEKRVYWVDIPNGKMFRYDPATGKHEQVYQGEQIGGFTVQADGALLLFMDKGAIAIWRDGKPLEYLVKEIPEERAAGARFNDVRADPEGRVFCGTMATKSRPGRLYRLDTDGSLRVVQENVGVSNGIGFTGDLKRMYYTDTTPHDIYLYDYDRKTGNLSNRRVFVHTEGEGGPDGMTMDAEDHVWSARWDGWGIFRYSPQGKQVDYIRFPAKQVSSAILGGDDLSDMYVTTAGGHDKKANGPGAGALFRLRPGVKGRPEFFSRVGLAKRDKRA